MLVKGEITWWLGYVKEFGNQFLKNVVKMTVF